MVSGNERSLSSQEIPREETEPQLYSILHIKKYGQRRRIRKNPWRKPSHIQVLKWMFSSYVVTMETGARADILHCYLTLGHREKTLNWTYFMKQSFVKLLRVSSTIRIQTNHSILFYLQKFMCIQVLSAYASL